MGITEVIRGDDHLSNTPKQLLVFEALGISPPRYAHVPLLHGPDGKKLSKRHGAASVQELRDAGYLPAAVRNYVALLGWGPGDDETLLSTDELVARFRPQDVGRSSAVFDEKKLRWMNGRYMREMDLDDYTAAVAAFTGRQPDSSLRAACAIAQEKAQTLDEVWPLIRFLFEEPVDDEKAWRKTMKEHAAPALLEVRRSLEGLDEFGSAGVESALEAIPDRLGLKPGKVYQPVRVAITGTTVSPGIFESVSALGKQKSLDRIDLALGRLSAGAPPPPA
jgi:glutamyl-tRNA synthetase